MALTGVAGTARPEHIAYVAGPAVVCQELEQAMGLHVGEFDSRSPCRVALSDARPGAF